MEKKEVCICEDSVSEGEGGGEIEPLLGVVRRAKSGVAQVGEKEDVPLGRDRGGAGGAGLGTGDR